MREKQNFNPSNSASCRRGRLSGVMKITAASPADIDEAVGCLASAFAQDPITGFLLQTSQGYLERLKLFFSLLMRARVALEMPVLVARGTRGIGGASMGYS